MDEKRVHPRAGPKTYILLNKPRGFVTTVVGPAEPATRCSTSCRGTAPRDQAGRAPGRPDRGPPAPDRRRGPRAARHASLDRAAPRSTGSRSRENPAEAKLVKLRRGIYARRTTDAPLRDRARLDHRAGRGRGQLLVRVMLTEGRTRQIRRMFEIDRPSRLEAEARGDRTDPRRAAAAGRLPAGSAEVEVEAPPEAGKGDQAGELPTRSSSRSTDRPAPGSPRWRGRSPRGSVSPTSTRAPCTGRSGSRRAGPGHRLCRSPTRRPSPHRRGALDRARLSGAGGSRVFSTATTSRPRSGSRRSRSTPRRSPRSPRSAGTSSPCSAGSRPGAGGVLEGRDIGTKVFPDTPHKFFLTAVRAEVRAERRTRELAERGTPQPYEDVLWRDGKARPGRRTPQGRLAPDPRRHRIPCGLDRPPTPRTSWHGDRAAGFAGRFDSGSAAEPIGYMFCESETYERGSPFSNAGRKRQRRRSGSRTDGNRSRN